MSIFALGLKLLCNKIYEPFTGRPSKMWIDISNDSTNGCFFPRNRKKMKTQPAENILLFTDPRLWSAFSPDWNMLNSSGDNRTSNFGFLSLHLMNN
jgi:hypothetical protein